MMADNPFIENGLKTEDVEKKKEPNDTDDDRKVEKTGVEKKESNLYSEPHKTEDDFDVRNEVISFELKNFLKKNLTISRVRALSGEARLTNGEGEEKEKPRLTNGQGSLHIIEDKNPTKETKKVNEEGSLLSNGKGFEKNAMFAKNENFDQSEDEYEGEGNLIIDEGEEEMNNVKKDGSFFKQDEEYPSMDDDDEGVYFNTMMDCVILEEGDECLRFDDKPSDSEENTPLPLVPAVNGSYHGVANTNTQLAPAKKRKKRTPSKISNDAVNEDPCEVIWSNPNENGNCKVCRGHCPGSKCRKCQEVEVQGRKRYVCLLCGKTINHMGNFGQHVRSHVSPICHICHKTFKMLRALEQHMQFHKKKMQIPTKKRRKQKTPIKIEPTANLEEPAVGDDGEIEGLDCFLPPNENSMSPPYETNGDICELLQVDILAKTDDGMPNGKDLHCYNAEEEEAFNEDAEVEFTDEVDVNEQINAIDLSISTGHGGEIYRCEYCFGTNCQPKKCQKSKVETLEDRITYECLICGKVIVNHKGNFKQHVRSHTDFCCKVCGKKFSDALRLKKHTELHAKKKTYQCGLCPKAFRVPHHLTMHRERAHISEKKYNCTSCAEVFVSRGELMSHIKWVHMQDGRPFKCELCQKTFAYKNNLKIHMRIHTNDKPYACEVCGRAFTQSSSLKMHMSVHAGNRNVFKCGACDKSFPYASNLKLHIKSAHSGLNPARRKSTTCACQLCGKAFTHRNSLKAHMRTAHPFIDYAKMEEQTEKVKPKPANPNSKLTSRNDNKYRPHICPTCGRGFTQRGSLSTHMRVLHNSYLIPKPVANKTLPFLTSLLPPEISVVMNPVSPTATATSTSQRQPSESESSQPSRFDVSQFFNCNVCGSLFTHFEQLESHVCINSV